MRRYLIGSIFITAATWSLPASAILTSIGNELWHQNIPGIGGAAEGGDYFGSAVASGDFNGDGFADIAVGVPGEAIGDISSAGGINIIYGTANGFSSSDSRTFYQGQSSGIGEVAEESDRFGQVLAVGNFNGDAYDDLAVGIPYEDVGSTENAGLVTIIYGSSSGLTEVGSLTFSQSELTDGGLEEIDNYFGWSLAAGDFNGDDIDDLIIGVPYETVNDEINAGQIHHIRGTSDGLYTLSAFTWHQDTVSIVGAAEADDLFGYSVISGDFDNDGYDDLAIGVIGESIGDIENAGAVNIIYGTSIGLDTPRNQGFHQNSQGLQDTAEMGDEWGWSLASGDFDNDGFMDLAVGAHEEDVDGISAAGGVQVLYSDNTGLTTRNQWLTADSMGLGNPAEPSDRFGHALSAGDFSGDDIDDLAITELNGFLPGSIPTAGIVQVLRGSVSGLTGIGSQVWSQDSPEILGDAQFGESFGSALAASDINGDGIDDLTVGVPWDQVDGIQLAGAINVLFGGDIIFENNFGAF